MVGEDESCNDGSVQTRLGYHRSLKESWISDHTWGLIAQRKLLQQKRQNESNSTSFYRDYIKKDREVKRSAQKDKHEWFDRQAQEAEGDRQAQEAEGDRQAQEAEDDRQAQEAEDDRQAREAVDDRQAQEAEDDRQAQEAVDDRQAQEAGDDRQAQEAEDDRQAQEAVDDRQAQEAVDDRQAQEAVDDRHAQEAGDDRQAQEAEDAAARNDTRQVYHIAKKITGSTKARSDQGQRWISNIERRGQLERRANHFKKILNRPALNKATQTDNCQNVQ